MEMDWLLLTIAVTAVAWIVIRRRLKKKEAVPPKETASEETPTEEAKGEETPIEEEKGEEEEKKN